LKDFMQKTLEGVPEQEFPRPENAVSTQICVDSGLLKSGWCPPGRIKWGTFWPGKAPKSECNVHGLRIIPAEPQEQPEGETVAPETPEGFKREVF
jgi:membrane carboxypeptidase/penicillin-binding protein